MKKKLLITAIAFIGLVGLGVYLTQPIKAGDSQRHFDWQKKLEAKAEFFGLTPEQLQEELETKTFAEIAEENEIDLSQFHEQMLEKKQEYWREKGLSEEEIAARLEKMAEKKANCDGLGKGPMFWGHKFKGG